MPAKPGEELWHWLYGELRAAILDRRLKPGSRMPSSRNLASQYEVSRGTVVAAFDHLKSEGYIQMQVGAGAFVATPLPDDCTVPAQGRAAVPKSTSHANLSRRGRSSVENILLLPPSHSLGKAFRSYEPAIDLFPTTLWARIAGRVLRRAPRSLYGQGDARGYLPLRKAIAEYVGGARGVRCSAEQVIVTTGAQQALDLVSRLLLDPGDAAWVEDPGYPGAMFALKAAGAKLAAIPTDQDGLDVEWGKRHAPHAKLAYVTPANQFPSGVAMPLERRLALLEWASKEGAWIVEDDYDAEYRYSGRPLAALQSLDRAESVLYVGTFTKMLFNALRLGFLILPPRLVESFAAARSFSDRHPPTLDQAILAEFMSEGHFGHHVRRMRQIYAERLGVLVEAANRQLSGALEVVSAVTGMRTLGWLCTDEKDWAVAERARSQGLELAALSQFTLRHSQRPALIIGFAGCTPAELRRGIDVLANVLGA
jgi:GntR family transcriptional regulator / MocR family aminotransferase